MQQLMLLHSLTKTETDILYTQIRYTLSGAVDPLILKQTWQKIVMRHSALRTGFIWVELPLPLQVVWQEANLSFIRHDLRRLPPGEQQSALTDILASDNNSISGRPTLLLAPVTSTVCVMRILLVIVDEIEDTHDMRYLSVHTILSYTDIFVPIT